MSKISDLCLKNKKLFIGLIFLFGIVCLPQEDSFCTAIDPQFISKQQFNNDVVLLRLAHGTKQAHPTNIVAKEVAKEISQKTNGKVRLEIYDNMQFGQEAELVEMVQKGNLDLAIVSTGVLSSYDAAFNIFGLPYLFNSEQQAYQALDGEPGKKVLNSLQNCGIIGICYWANGLRYLTTRNRVVKTPEDIKDLYIRVMPNPIYLSFFSKLGAKPTPMEWGEVIPAFKSGIIEAQENSVPIIYQNNLEQYQHYLILTGHTFDPHIVLASNSLRIKLTEDEFNLVYSVFQNARLRQRRLITEQSESYLNLLAERMTVIKPDIDEFRRLGREFSKETIKMFDPEIRECFERYLQ